MDPSNIIVLIAIILVISVLVYPTVRDRLFHIRAQREGVLTEATITRKEIIRSRVSKYCALEYSYLDHDRLELVKRDGYDAVEVGDRIKVVYLFTSPHDARIIDPRITDTKQQ